MEDLINRFAQEEQLETVEHGDFLVGVGTLIRLLEKDRAEQLILYPVSKSLPTKEEVITEGDKQIDDWLSENHHKERIAYKVGFRRSFEYVLRKINVC